MLRDYYRLDEFEWVKELLQSWRELDDLTEYDKELLRAWRGLDDLVEYVRELSRAWRGLDDLAECVRELLRTWRELDDRFKNIIFLSRSQVDYVTYIDRPRYRPDTIEVVLSIGNNLDAIGSRWRSNPKRFVEIRKCKKKLKKLNLIVNIILIN